MNLIINDQPKKNLAWINNVFAKKKVQIGIGLNTKKTTSRSNTINIIKI
jgi:hypothetical protein